MMDDTSWGSGIEQLSLLFIQYGLAPWFISWEQAVNRSLLSPQDIKNGYYADFDERELLRGSMKDQAEYYTKALGTQKGWTSQNEVRDILGLGRHQDLGADSITPAIAIGKTNEKVA
jgi:phage portal protein BeeE